MLLVSIILFFSLLALGLLALLDRYDTAILKAQAERRSAQSPRPAYYDAFAERRQPVRNALPAGQHERRKIAA